MVYVRFLNFLDVKIAQNPTNIHIFSYVCMLISIMYARGFQT